MTRLLVGGRLYWLSPRFVLMAVPIIIYALIESTSWDVFWVGEQLLATVEFTRLMKAKGGGEWVLMRCFDFIRGDKLAIGCSDNSTVFRTPPLTFSLVLCLMLCEKSFSGSLSLSLCSVVTIEARKEFIGSRARSAGPESKQQIRATRSYILGNSDQNLTLYWSSYTFLSLL